MANIVEFKHNDEIAVCRHVIAGDTQLGIWKARALSPGMMILHFKEPELVRCGDGEVYVAGYITCEECAGQWSDETTPRVAGTMGWHGDNDIMARIQAGACSVLDGFSDRS